LKIKGDTTCPGCKKDHTVELDIDKLDIKTPEAPAQMQNAQTTGQQTQQITKPEIKEVIKTVSPKDEPFYKCKNGNCGKGAHSNPNYSVLPDQKCENCGALNGQKICKTCGNKDEENFSTMEKEELEELGIPMPKEDDHEGHDHE